MAELYSTQSDLIKELFNKNDEIIDKLTSNCNSFIHSINEDRSEKYSYIHDIFYRTNENYREFYDEFTTYTYEFEIKHWYDMNQKRFIEKIDKYSGDMLYNKEVNINIYSLNVSDSTIKETNTKSLLKYDFDCKYIKILLDQEIANMKTSHGGSCIVYFTDFLKLKTSYKLHIVIDDYFNIYLPDINTLIIYNYIKFPLYSLFLLNDSIKLKDTYSLNEYNKEDNIIFQQLKIYFDLKQIYSPQNIICKFNDGQVFENIFNFIEYNKYIKKLKQFLNLSDYIQDTKDKKNTNIDIKQSEQLCDTILSSFTLTNDDKQLDKISENKTVNIILLENILLLKQENKKLKEKNEELTKININLDDKLLSIKKII